jgi:hypothetical protein
MRSFLLAPLLTPLLLAGCGGGSSSTGTGGGGASSTGITGQVTDVYRPSTGEVSVPNGGVWTAIDALVPKEGGYTSFAGTIDAGGKVSIPGVPEGPYLLALTNLPSALTPGAQLTRTFYGTSSRTVDLGALYSHRPDTAPLTKPTKLVIDATLSLPWQTYTLDAQGNVIQPVEDDLQFFSRNGGVTGTVQALQSMPEENRPLDGAQALSSWSIDAATAFASLGHPALLDGSKGDELVVLHDVGEQVGMDTGDDPWSGYQFSATREVFRPAAFTMSDGGTSVLSGAFTSLPQKSFALDYRGAAFNALFADLQVTNVFTTITLDLEAAAPLPANGAFATLVGMSTFTKVSYQAPECAGSSCNEAQCPGGCDLGTPHHPGDHAHSYSYGNPFDFGQELVSLSLFFQRSVKGLLPEMTAENLNGQLTLQAPAAELDGKPLQPTLGLPRDITVAGKATPYDQVSGSIGTTPELRWTAPSLGTPTHYRVAVIDLSDFTASDGTTVKRRNVAALNVTSPQITLPDGILKTGTLYYFQVTAVARDDDDLSAPFAHPVHEARATMFTGVVTP